VNSFSTIALSIFIDESGDFGEYATHSPYYWVTMVFHDQSVDISLPMSALDNTILNSGYHIHAIHVGPLIRRESPYLYDMIQQRKKLLNALSFFTRSVDIRYHTFVVSKHECPDIISLTERLSTQVSAFFKTNLEYFLDYDKVLVYYDNQLPHLNL